MFVHLISVNTVIQKETFFQISYEVQCSGKSISHLYSAKAMNFTVGWHQEILPLSTFPLTRHFSSQSKYQLEQTLLSSLIFRLFYFYFPNQIFVFCLLPSIFNFFVQAEDFFELEFILHNFNFILMVTFLERAIFFIWKSVLQTEQFEGKRKKSIVHKEKKQPTHSDKNCCLFYMYMIFYALVGTFMDYLLTNLGKHIKKTSYIPQKMFVCTKHLLLTAYYMSLYCIVLCSFWFTVHNSY